MTAPDPTAGTVLPDDWRKMIQAVAHAHNEFEVAADDAVAELVPLVESLLSAAREAGLNEGRGDLEWHERRVRRECAGQLREWADVIERQNVYDDPVKASVAAQLRAVAETWAPDA